MLPEAAETAARVYDEHVRGGPYVYWHQVLCADVQKAKPVRSLD